jgi:hypothetical protein
MRLSALIFLLLLGSSLRAQLTGSFDNTPLLQALRRQRQAAQTKPGNPEETSDKFQQVHVQNYAING